MSQILLAHETYGAVWSPKLLDYNDSEPARRTEKVRAIDGSTVHRIYTTDDGDREITGTLVCSEASESIIKSIYRASTGLVMHLQDGRAVFKGYLQSLNFVSSSKSGKNRYSFSFFVTERLSA